MYEENNVTYHVGINWKDVLVKIILLILFILLLVWIFPRPNMSVFYDSVYRDNVNTMRESARNYYTIDRLPKSVGEQTSMTLKEMVDNHLLIRFTDKNGKTCDESTSKVEVTKSSDSEYTLKVVLNCGDTKDYILETIGCTTVCSNGTCTTVINNSKGSNTIAANNGSVDSNYANNNNNGSDLDISGQTGNTGATEVDDTDYSDYDVKDGKWTTKITYYQHRKAVVTYKTTYSCPAGYTRDGKKCYKNTTGATIDATPHYTPDQVVTVDALIGQGEDKKVYTDVIKTQTGTDYTCPTGYTLNGQYCIKYTDAIEKPGDKTYTCPKDYTLNGTKCTKTIDATYKPGTTSYTCDQGGTLNGTKCTITKAATENISYTCPSGYTKNGTSCYKVYDATTKYSCPSGYSQNGSKCTKQIDQSYDATRYISSYSCPRGGSLSGTNCVVSSSYGATPHYKTVYGNWINQGTRYFSYKIGSGDGVTTKYVFNGVISGAACGAPCGNKGTWYQYIYYTRSTSQQFDYYTCPNGGTLSNGRCYTSSSYTASPNYAYKCPNGGSLSGTRCIKKSTDTKDASKTYVCNSGDTLNGSKCTHTIAATKTTNYTCPSGYTLSGKNCTYTYNATPHEGTGSYTCPSGYVLNGKKCTHTIDATVGQGQSTWYCPDGYELLKDNTHRCIRRIDATATPVYSYTCPTGYTAEGTGANTKCYKIVHIDGYYCADAGATLTADHKCVKTVPGQIDYYTCPTGYTLNGTKCTKKSVVTIDATKKTKKYTSYKYTWSKSSYLSGWEFTGKTKVKTQTHYAGQK